MIPSMMGIGQDIAHLFKKIIIGKFIVYLLNQTYMPKILTKNEIELLKFNNDGLIPVIAQCHKTNEVLMMAWMNKESILLTIKKNKVTYFSRSRKNCKEGD